MIFLARVLLLLGTVWMIPIIPAIGANWPLLPEDAREDPGMVMLVAHSVPAPASPAPANCWVPYHDTAVLGVIHLRVDRVLDGTYRDDTLVCLDHLYQLQWPELGGLFGVRLELSWDEDLGLYRVSSHRAATTWKTIVYCVLPASLGYLLLRLARRRRCPAPTP